MPTGVYKHLHNPMLGEKTRFKKGHKSWMKDNKGLKGWHNISGLRPHKKGEFKHTEESKKKDSLNRSGKCVREQHHNWKGGISMEYARIHTSEWREIRQKVYVRDNWTCQICGEHCHNNIQCHHIVPYRIIKDNSLTNLITLCCSCHIKEEHRYYRNLSG